MFRVWVCAAACCVAAVALAEEGAGDARYASDPVYRMVLEMRDAATRAEGAANPAPRASAPLRVTESEDRVIISNVPDMALSLPEPVDLSHPRSIAVPAIGAGNATWKRLDERYDLEERLPRLRSWAAVVVDQEEGRLLYAKNPDAIRSIASITKLMSAMVVLDSGAALDQVLTIEGEDVDTLKGSSSRLRVGTKLTRREMLKLSLMSSENRATAALARSYPQGKAAFVAAMNAKAAALGMQDTRFLDPTGLDPYNRSTAYDLALLVNAGYEYPLIRDFTTSSGHSVALRGRRHPQRMAFHNSNGLVGSERWEIGLSKTGYINEAGRCLVLQATIANKPVIIVLLDSLGTFSRLADANRIKRWIEGLDTASSGARRM